MSPGNRGQPERAEVVEDHRVNTRAPRWTNMNPRMDSASDRPGGPSGRREAGLLWRGDYKAPKKRDHRQIFRWGRQIRGPCGPAALKRGGRARRHRECEWAMRVGLTLFFYFIPFCARLARSGRLRAISVVSQLRADSQLPDLTLDNFSLDRVPRVKISQGGRGS